MPTHILLIRHGETAWNREQRIQGQKDVPLSALGEEQARLLGRRLGEVPLAAAYASDSLRARRTAEIALEGRGVPLTLSPALRERNFGSWEGLLWTEIERLFPEEARRFFEDSVRFTVAGGETWNQMQSRVFQEVERIAARHAGRTVALFTHGGPCKAAVLAALGLPALQWRQWVAANASLHRLVREEAADGQGRVLWKLAGFNDVAHLEEAHQLADPSAQTLIETEKAV